MIQKPTQCKTSKQHKTQQNKTTLVQSLLMTLGQETSLFYNAPVLSSHGGADGQTDLDKVIVKDKIIEHCDIYCRMLTEVLLTYLLNLLTYCNISNHVIHLSGTLALLSIICSTCHSAAFNCMHHPLHTILSVLLVLHSAQAGLNRHLTMVSCHQSSW